MVLNCSECYCFEMILLCYKHIQNHINLLRSNHLTWINPLIELYQQKSKKGDGTCSSVRIPNLIPASFKLVPSLCAVFAILAALSYPIFGFKAVTSINDSCKSWEMRFSFAVIPLTQCSTNELLESANNRIE